MGIQKRISFHGRIQIIESERKKAANLGGFFVEKLDILHFLGFVK